MNAELWPEAKGGMRLIKSSRMPGHRTRVLVVDRDPSAVATIRGILRAEDWELISVRTGTEALDKARLEGPDAVLTELNLSDMSGLDLCQRLHERSETASTPIIVLSASTAVSERVASLRAGASDYLVKPPDPQELLARLKAVLDLRKEKAGFIIAVLGSKGGVGASVLAVNLAVALRRETRRGVVLMDAVVRYGVADVLLNLRAAKTAGHLLAQFEQLEEADFEAILTPHASGLQALLLREQGLDEVKPEEMRQILITLRRMRDLIVVDTSPLGNDENTANVLELADRVLLVLTPEIPALRGAKQFLQQAGDLGLSRERIVPVLNRYPQRGGLQRQAIEHALGITIQATIPDDIKLVAYSVNRGVPAVESHARSGVAHQVSSLASSLAKFARQS